MSENVYDEGATGPNFLTNPFTSNAESKRFPPLLVTDLNLRKPLAMEIPMSKWSHSPESPIDAARGLLSRRNLRTSDLFNETIQSPVDLQISPRIQTATVWSSLAHSQVEEQYRSPTSAIQERFRCICGSVYDKIDDFYEHSAKSCITNMHVCDICRRGFTRSKDLKQHKMVHTIRTVICSGCGQKFPRIQSLNRHQKLCNQFSRVLSD